MSQLKQKSPLIQDDDPTGKREAFKEPFHTVGEDLTKLTEVAREAARDEVARARERGNVALHDAHDKTDAWDRRVGTAHRAFRSGEPVEAGPLRNRSRKRFRNAIYFRLGGLQLDPLTHTRS